MVRFLGVFLILSLLCSGSRAGSPDLSRKPYPPRPAVGVFSSANYALTFPAPANVFYCPVPDDWAGSDHGTIIFFQRPNSCYRPGYPSSDRGFEPNVARIEIYYGLNDGGVGDFSDLPAHCKPIGRMKLLGSFHRVCRLPEPGQIALSVAAKYQSSGVSDLDVTLVTTRQRLSNDLPIFRRFVASIRTCTDTDARLTGPASQWGSGPPCLAGNWY